MRSKPLLPHGWRPWSSPRQAKLAKLVLDEAGRNATFKTLATAALAGTKGADAVAALIDRRLNALQRAKGFIGWEKRRAFVQVKQARIQAVEAELRV